MVRLTTLNPLLLTAPHTAHEASNQGFRLSHGHPSLTHPHGVVGSSTLAGDDDALLASAMEMAPQLARLLAHGVIEARRIFDAAQGNDLPTQLEYEANRQRQLLDLQTLEEGVAAFFEKRLPNFPG